MSWVAVGMGGALGSMARHVVNIVVARAAGQPSPYSTAIVNIVGCACVGALAGAIAAGRLQMSPSSRAFVFVGLLGGFTTFSSLGLDTLTLAVEGRRMAAMINVAGQVGLGLLSVFGAYTLAVKLS